jgi:hypothetical protein
MRSLEVAATDDAMMTAATATGTTRRPPQRVKTEPLRWRYRANPFAITSGRRKQHDQIQIAVNTASSPAAGALSILPQNSDASSLASAHGLSAHIPSVSGMVARCQNGPLSCSSQASRLAASHGVQYSRSYHLPFDRSSTMTNIKTARNQEKSRPIKKKPPGHQSTTATSSVSR